MNKASYFCKIPYSPLNLQKTVCKVRLGWEVPILIKFEDPLYFVPALGKMSALLFSFYL